MLKKSFLILMFMPFFSNAQEASNLRPWVKAATMINMRLDGLPTQIPIEDKANVMDIKQKIRKYEAIPTEHQIIKPYWKRWWTLWLSEGFGPELRNDESVKKVMSLHNTDLFEMHDARTTRKNGKLSLK